MKGGCDFWHWEKSYCKYLVKMGYMESNEVDQLRSEKSPEMRTVGREEMKFAVREASVSVGLGKEMLSMLKLAVLLLAGIFVLCLVIVIKM